MVAGPWLATEGFRAPSERVHHKNGIRDDNTPTNLELWSTTQPAGKRVTDLVAWARDLLDTYAEEFAA